VLWRRFLVEHRINEGLGRVLVSMPELGNLVGVEQAFQTFYEPLPAAYAGEDGIVPICKVSGTVLRRGTAASLTRPKAGSRRPCASREPASATVARGPRTCAC
jgi:hypothetical protein